MYFGKITILLIVAISISVNAAKRKTMKSKIKKANIQNIAKPPCGCQNPLIDIINCGCKGPIIDPVLGSLPPIEIAVPRCRGPIEPSLEIAYAGRRGPVIEPALGPINPLDILIPGCRGPVIEPALAPVEIVYPGCRGPVIEPLPSFEVPVGCRSSFLDIPLEFNPLGCLFPSLEIPNFGLLSAPVTLPSVEYFTAVELPCGCPAPNCGCRAPAVKLPTYPREYLTSIEVPNCACQGLPPAYSYGSIGTVIELPSYQISSGCRGTAPACGCQGSCACPGIPISSCGCQVPCSCPGVPVSCGCQGPCSCSGIPISSCGCQGSCSCGEYQLLSCGCKGSCSCLAIAPSCGCQGPCGCPRMPASCACQGPCSCPALPLPVGLLPAVEVPCGCGCGVPGCQCGKYLRQVTLQPPFL